MRKGGPDKTAPRLLEELQVTSHLVTPGPLWLGTLRPGLARDQAAGSPGSPAEVSHRPSCLLSAQPCEMLCMCAHTTHTRVHTCKRARTHSAHARTHMHAHTFMHGRTHAHVHTRWARGAPAVLRRRPRPESRLAWRHTQVRPTLEEGGAPKSLPWCSLLILGHQFWGDLWSPEVCYGWHGGSMPGMCQATGLRACWGHGAASADMGRSAGGGPGSVAPV